VHKGMTVQMELAPLTSGTCRFNLGYATLSMRVVKTSAYISRLTRAACGRELLPATGAAAFSASSYAMPLGSISRRGVG